MLLITLAGVGLFTLMVALSSSHSARGTKAKWSRIVTSILITGAEGIFTGLPGGAMRAKGAIRVVHGRIAGIGELDPRAGEERIDASGCVVYPGLIDPSSPFPERSQGRACGDRLPAVPVAPPRPLFHWHKIDEEALRVAARIGLVELMLSGTTTAADHHYMFAQDYRFDPAHVIFEVAQELGIRLVFCRGGATHFRGFDIPDIIPMPTEPLDHMMRSVEDCARHYHDPSSNSTRRVAFAVTTPPWGVAPDELKIIAASARGMGLRIHSHLSETRDYVDYCLADGRPAPWMALITMGSAPTCGSPISFTSTTVSALAGRVGTGTSTAAVHRWLGSYGVAGNSGGAGGAGRRGHGAANRRTARHGSARRHSAGHTHPAMHGGCNGDHRRGRGAVPGSWRRRRVLGFEDAGGSAPARPDRNYFSHG